VEIALLWALAFGAAVLVLSARLRVVLTVGPVAATALGGAGLMLIGLGQVFAVLPALLGCGVAAAGAYAYRFMIADRNRRHMQRSFSKYLSPAVVDKLAENGVMPKLGGERRVVTIWFSDLANFTTMSEKMAPEELVEALNAYLSIVTQAITAHGGMIDKYIGDAVVGGFGAPLDDPDHAAHGLAAAYFAKKPKPEQPWQTLEDVRDFLELFHHRFAVGDYDGAFAAVRLCDECLELRGFYSTQVELYEQLATVWQVQNTQNNLNCFTVLTCLGNTFYFLGEFKKALSFHQDALRVAKEIGDSQKEAVSFGNLCNDHNSLGEYKKAISFGKEAVNIR